MFDSPFPKRKSPSPFPRSGPGIPLPRFSCPVHCAFRCLSEPMESPPFPTLSPTRSPLHHIDSHPAFPFTHHHTTLTSRAARLPATGRQAPRTMAARGGKESICGTGRDGTTPRHPHSLGAIVTYKKKSPHHERNSVTPFSSTYTARETAPCHFCSPHPLHYPCLSHTLRETQFLGPCLPAPSLVSLSLPTLRVYHTL